MRSVAPPPSPPSRAGDRGASPALPGPARAVARAPREATPRTAPPGGRGLRGARRDRGRRRARGRQRALGDLPLELDHVHVDGGRVQGNRLTVDQQGRRLHIHGFPQREERLPEAASRLRLPHAAPEQGGELRPGMRSAGREREEREEGLGLPGRQNQGHRRAESTLKPAEESEIETRHGPERVADGSTALREAATRLLTRFLTRTSTDRERPLR